MAVIVSGRGKKFEDSIGVKPGGEPPVFFGGISEPGEFIIKGPAPRPHPPLKASPDLEGVVHVPGEDSKRVSFRPHPDDVDRSIQEIKTRHLRPPIPTAPARIHDGVKFSPVVVRPPGWVAQKPTYPRPLGATPMHVRPGPLKIPFKEPRPSIVMPAGVIHGGGARADEVVPSRFPVEDITKGPFEIRIHDYGNYKTHKSSLRI